VFVVVTANDISKLPPELFRSERFDAVFMIDLPNAEQKRRIWDMYLKMFCLDCRQPLPKDEQWTGAEIRCCCRLAALLDVPLLQAAQNVVPVATTAAESVERLRSWANGRCLSADKPGLYRHCGGSSLKQVRRVSRDPTNN
jgi:SpoVK/Ycf46/Vps4 family AAA+-type ATPase